MDQSADTALGKWSVPECPFEVEYSARVLDDIRLAVVDAFFSLPRGGAEIGGILLGQYEDGRIAITDFAALDCEHALGPSFTLSVRDQTRLAELIAEARRNGPDRQPVGWYHSHTRSEIFLSEADRALHTRYFPEPWQIALVLKPHTFEPTRAGFFFRGRDGSMKCDASYQEFRLDPMPLRGNGSPVAAKLLARKRAREEEVAQAALPLEFPTPRAEAPVPTPVPEFAAEPVKPKTRVPITREIRVPESATEAPEFGQLAPQRSGWVFKAAAIVAVGLAAGGAGYQTRDSWLPRLMAKTRAVLPHEPVPYLSLGLADDNGQLKIQWDHNSPAVRNAREATLQIVDGNMQLQSVRLDAAHLASGALTYERQSERVDVTMIATDPGGRSVKEQSTFLGKAPAPVTVDDSQAARERDAATERADKLQKDLNFQMAKNRRLEKDLRDVEEALRQQTSAPPKKD